MPIILGGALIAVCVILWLIQSGTEAARQQLEAFAAQSMRRLWTSTAINCIAVVLVYEELHRAHAVYAVLVSSFWIIPNIRSLNASLTHASEVVGSERGPIVAYFFGRGLRASLRENPALYARWKVAVAAWALTFAGSSFYGAYDLGYRSSDTTPTHAEGAQPTAVAAAAPIDAAVARTRLSKGAVLRRGPGKEFRPLRVLSAEGDYVVVDTSVPGWIKVEDGAVVAWTSLMPESSGTRPKRSLRSDSSRQQTIKADAGAMEPIDPYAE